MGWLGGMDDTFVLTLAPYYTNRNGKERKGGGRRGQIGLKGGEEGGGGVHTSQLCGFILFYLIFLTEVRREEWGGC